MKNHAMKSTLAPRPGIHPQIEAGHDQSLFRRWLGKSVSAAVRIHQYRNLHSAMVYEALRELDRCDQS
jgi:hypothetical protein